MTPKTVWAVYFSGTGTTERTVRSVAGELARMLSVPCRSFDFTRPQARQKELSFCERDLVVFGTPVYAGRVPMCCCRICGKRSGAEARWRCRWCCSATGTMMTR